ncbi:hypothetical protein DIPPA_05667, partial [Diplonema papillatum]
MPLSSDPKYPARVPPTALNRTALAALSEGGAPCKAPSPMRTGTPNPTNRCPAASQAPGNPQLQPLAFRLASTVTELFDKPYAAQATGSGVKPSKSAVEPGPKQSPPSQGKKSAVVVYEDPTPNNATRRARPAGDAPNTSILLAMKTACDALATPNTLSQNNPHGSTRGEPGPVFPEFRFQGHAQSIPETPSQYPQENPHRQTHESTIPQLRFQIHNQRLSGAVTEHPQRNPHRQTYASSIPQLHFQSQRCSTAPTALPQSIPRGQVNEPSISHFQDQRDRVSRTPTEHPQRNSQGKNYEDSHFHAQPATLAEDSHVHPLGLPRPVSALHHRSRAGCPGSKGAVVQEGLCPVLPGGIRCTAEDTESAHLNKHLQGCDSLSVKAKLVSAVVGDTNDLFVVQSPVTGQSKSANDLSSTEFKSDGADSYNRKPESSTNSDPCEAHLGTVSWTGQLKRSKVENESGNSFHSRKSVSGGVHAGNASWARQLKHSLAEADENGSLHSRRGSGFSRTSELTRGVRTGGGPTESNRNGTHHLPPASHQPEPSKDTQRGPPREGRVVKAAPISSGGSGFPNSGTAADKAARKHSKSSLATSYLDACSRGGDALQSLAVKSAGKDNHPSADLQDHEAASDHESRDARVSSLKAYVVGFSKCNDRCPRPSASDTESADRAPPSSRKCSASSTATTLYLDASSRGVASCKSEGARVPPSSPGNVSKHSDRSPQTSDSEARKVPAVPRKCSASSSAAPNLGACSVSSEAAITTSIANGPQPDVLSQGAAPPPTNHTPATECIASFVTTDGPVVIARTPLPTRCAPLGAYDATCGPSTIGWANPARSERTSSFCNDEAPGSFPAERDTNGHSHSQPTTSKLDRRSMESGGHTVRKHAAPPEPERNLTSIANAERDGSPDQQQQERRVPVQADSLNPVVRPFNDAQFSGRRAADELSPVGSQRRRDAPGAGLSFDAQAFAPESEQGRREVGGASPPPSGLSRGYSFDTQEFAADRLDESG